MLPASVASLAAQLGHALVEVARLLVVLASSFPLFALPFLFAPRLGLAALMASPFLVGLLVAAMGIVRLGHDTA